MDKNFELKYHELEEGNWWFKGRRDIIMKLMKKLNISSSQKILEIGCSGGAMIKRLDKAGFKDIVGIDISRDAINLCKKKGIKNVLVMDAKKTNFSDGQFDAIISSDILEHIEDDWAALKNWNRILKNNGKLVLFVPAFKSLWSEHDAINHHHRRYSKKELTTKLRKSGFYLERCSYWNFSLFIPVYLMRLLSNLKRKNHRSHNLHKFPSLFNKALILTLKAENWLISKNVNFPWGISLFAVAYKKNNQHKSIKSI